MYSHNEYYNTRTDEVTKHTEGNLDHLPTYIYHLREEYIYVAVPRQDSMRRMLSCLGTAIDLLDIPRQLTWQDCID